MHTSKNGGRTLTLLDFKRLCQLNRGSLPEILDGEPPVADLVAPREVPADVVTMGSQVEVCELGTRLRRRLVLVYPASADAAVGRVSVLSPVGASLLGLRVGDTACWTTPHGDVCQAELTAILFQPEASGDYIS